MLSKNVDRWIEKWMAEGEAGGKTEGRAQGQIEGLRQAAKNLPAKGMSTAEISEVTGLTEEEINALCDSLAH
jgi:predicted transposase/invertase (TIGR01784 family)